MSFVTNFMNVTLYLWFKSFFHFVMVGNLKCALYFSTWDTLEMLRQCIGECMSNSLTRSTRENMFGSAVESHGASQCTL